MAGSVFFRFAKSLHEGKGDPVELTECSVKVDKSEILAEQRGYALRGKCLEIFKYTRMGEQLE